MQFEYDPERLIEEVKKRPGIWDYGCIEYRDKHARQKLWGEIVKELNSSTVQASKSEMRELELQLQKKWKGIRDCYNKFLSKPNRHKRPYIYNRQLQFLQKTLKKLAPQSEHDENEEASSNSDEEDRKKGKWKLKKMMKLSTTELNDDEEPEVEQVDYSNNEDSRSVEETEDRPISEYFAFENVEPVQKIEEDDSDKLFLLSLLPHLKKVPEYNRLNAKMELMAVLRSFQSSTDRKLF